VVWLGSALPLNPNVATSLPDPVFDGARAYADWRSGRIDAFAFNRCSGSPAEYKYIIV
jgi:hypothetical protein